MILDPLPKYADPGRLADQLTVLEGEIDLATLGRLQDVAPGSKGGARARLTFRRDEMKRVVMSGSAQAPLLLVCQRCGLPFSEDVEAEWRIVLARSLEDERSLAEQGQDAWYHAAPLDVGEIVEQELILALPMAPRHLESCESQSQQAAAPHPFAALAGLFERGLRDKLETEDIK